MVNKKIVINEVKEGMDIAMKRVENDIDRALLLQMYGDKNNGFKKFTYNRFVESKFKKFQNVLKEATNKKDNLEAKIIEKKELFRKKWFFKESVESEIDDLWYEVRQVNNRIVGAKKDVDLFSTDSEIRVTYVRDALIDKLKEEYGSGFTDVVINKGIEVEGDFQDEDYVILKSRFVLNRSRTFYFENLRKDFYKKVSPKKKLCRCGTVLCEGCNVSSTNTYVAIPKKALERISDEELKYYDYKVENLDDGIVKIIFRLNETTQWDSPRFSRLVKYDINNLKSQGGILKNRGELATLYSELGKENIASALRNSLSTFVDNDRLDNPMTTFIENLCYKFTIENAFNLVCKLDIQKIKKLDESMSVIKNNYDRDVKTLRANNSVNDNLVISEDKFVSMRQELTDRLDVQIMPLLIERSGFEKKREVVYDEFKQIHDTFNNNGFRGLNKEQFKLAYGACRAKGIRI